MHYELAHDSIARQVYQKASTEARTRRKIERFVQERFLAYQDRKSKLTQDDLDYIVPYLEVVNLNQEERKFITDAQAGLRRARTQKRFLIAGVILVLSVISALAVWQWQDALKQKRTVEEQKTKVDEQKSQLEKHTVALLEKETDLKDALSVAKAANKEAEAKRLEAELAQVQAEQQSVFASLQQKIAEEQKLLADSSSQRAKEAQGWAELASEEAQANAIQAEENATKAYTAEQEALLLARSSELCATAIAEYNLDRTLALRYAFEACEFTNYENQLAVNTFLRFNNETDYCYYQSAFVDSIDRRISNTALAVSEDGKLVAVGKQNGTILILQFDGLRLLKRLPKGHSKTVRSLQFSEDNKLLMSGADDQKACLWNIPDGEIIHTYPFEGEVKAVALSSNQQSLFIAGEGGRVEHKVLSGASINCAITHDATIWDLAFSPDGQYIATADNNGRLKLWDSKGQNLIASARTKNASFRKLSFSDNGHDLAIADVSGATSIWQVQDLKLKNKLRQKSEKVYALDFSKDGRWLVQAKQYNILEVVELQSKKEPFQLIGHIGEVFDVSFSPNGESIITTGEDGSTKVWDWRYRETIQVLKEESEATFAVDYSSTGEWIVTGGYDREVRLFRNDGASEKPLWASKEGQDGYLKAVAFSSDDQEIWCVDFSGKAVLRKRNNGAVISELKVGQERVPAVTISQDGKWLAVASHDRIIDVWDLAKQVQIESIYPGFESTITALSFSEDGSLISAGTEGGEVLLLDWSSSRVLFSKTAYDLEPNGPLVTDIAVTNKGQMLAIGMQNSGVRLHMFGNTLKARRWSEEGYREPAVLNVQNLAFSQDGNWLFIGSSSGKAYNLWEVEKEQMVQSLALPTELAYTLRAVFNPMNANEVLVGCRDGQSRIVKNMPFVLRKGNRVAPMEQVKYNLDARNRALYFLN